MDAINFAATVIEEMKVLRRYVRRLEATADKMEAVAKGLTEEVRLECAAHRIDVGDARSWNQPKRSIHDD
jgi:hypothetical protein